jgi:hypothetical protein
MTLASAQYNPSSSSHDLISGYPTFLPATALYLEFFESILLQAVAQATAQAYKDLVAAARSNPEWRTVADYLTIDFDGEHISYGVSDDSVISKVTDLEFGTQTESPTGFLRKMAINQAPHMGAQIASVLNREIPIE